MNQRAAAEFAELEAERAEITISWLEEHADKIGNPDAVDACIHGAVGIRQRQQYAADLFREIDEVLAGAEPATVDLTPTRKGL